MDNLVLQQVLESRNEVLCVLTQKIVTTQKCVISEHVQSEETCGGMVGIQTKTIQVPYLSMENFAHRFLFKCLPQSKLFLKRVRNGTDSSWL